MNSLEKNEYRFKDEDLFMAIDFVKNYHLEQTKGLRGRTNQGKRGFGGELDEWIPGKLVEIGVCRILENFSNGKILSPDFKIYSDKVVGEKSDPDVTEVIDKNSAPRSPNIFVEIKRLDQDAEWLGPRQHQLKNLTDGFMIHASIEFEDDNSKKQHDITGSILKKISNSDFLDFSHFSNFNNLVLKVNYAYSFNDLRALGHFFSSGNIIPETEFTYARPAYKKDGSLSSVYKNNQKFSGRAINTMFWENKTHILSFTDWELDGEYEILKDKTGKQFI